ncbi:MAG: YchJ family protein [Gammaproteobacteria bacterium]
MNYCPCGSQQPYAACCEAYLLGKEKVPRAEALLRARYTAYTKKNIDYIAKTTGGEAATEFNRDEAERWAKQATWKGLHIIKQNASDEYHATIEFVVHYSIDNAEYDLHERSYFSAESGEWLYIAGEYPQVTTERVENKIGRNEPCSCGSGKKYKKCCGR